jgi:DNA mismatch endonuclease, patch repair protein
MANAEFWAMKYKDNKARDKRKRKELLALGWEVLEIWECEVKRGNWLDKAVAFLR